jgi:hypothetical protein
MWIYTSTSPIRLHGVVLHGPAALHSEKEPPVHIEYEVEWAPEPVWTARSKFLPLLGLELRPFGHPARSQSLYRLHSLFIRNDVEVRRPRFLFLRSSA